ncbi:MAG: 1-deoxy-D-xylulose-5-phosphate synthase [Lutibacter sp.]|uniref:1-deoxy-D-xylulose-5-phosphate synthase n=1 Tax=Lutibacter sp. TaxID=1925666 RepID=UPI0019EB0685|nr:1-deoxy-D-xylulose-5-phosphate synthase [Lutibacter sp.]NOR28803.1 1-deoxy-D-xylulose-5-phosphate synthase [Lutibacter sp.]
MKTNLLAHINNPTDLRKLSKNQLPKVAKELRDFIIDIVAVKEGHLGASLGVVELTIALHYVFDTPNDLLIWDVGHQAYGHKILTERRDKFHTNRQLGGIAGFPNRKESVYDAFGTGHSSTSISAALGMAIASKIKGDFDKHHIAVIGDASIASGMAFEGLNHAGVTDANLLIILNDNTMGIDPSVGALKNYFTNVKAGKKVRKNNIIEALNFNYSGPIDGHNINEVIIELKRLKSIKGPKFLHIITTKGKGLEKAEQDQVTYHAPGKFDKITGERITKNTSFQPPKFQDVFGETIVELAKKNDKIVGITPAMPTGSSLKLMLEELPNRAFDVGIAEQHAVTLAAGMATQGLIPFCTIYSTFLQRSYDQIIHDVALQNLSVIFCIDRAGIVGEDGATHHGVFDIAYLRCIPNLVIFAPLNEFELRNIMYTAQLGVDFPLAIRYPRGRGTSIDWKQAFSTIKIGKGECVSEGNEIAILTIGTIGNTIIELQKELPLNKFAHYNMRFVKPLDRELLHTVFKNFNTIITIEDGTIVGGFGSAILEFASNNNYKKNNIKNLGIPDTFIEHGTTEELFDSIQLSKEKLKDFLIKVL